MYDLAVLFVKLRAALASVEHVTLNDWSANVWHVQQAARVRDEILDVTFDDTDFSRDELVFATAAGVHDALAQADPSVCPISPTPLMPYRDRLLATSNLLPPDYPGVLLTCNTYPARAQSAPTDLDERFPRLRYVDAATAKRLSFHRLSRLSDLEDRGGTLRIAALPFLASPSDVSVVRTDRAGGSYYTGSPVTSAVIARIGEALTVLDDSGAQVGLLPELACNHELLTAWQDVCRTRPSGGDLRLLLIGSGPVEATLDGALLADAKHTGLPLNRGVVLDRRTGEVVLAQDKQRGFTMDEAYRARVGISDLGAGPLDELLPDAPGVNLLETRAGRFAVLICEDLGRLTDVGAVVRASGTTYALVPVFAPPIRAYRWQQTAGSVLVADGVSVVVVNGLTLGRFDLDDDAVTGQPAVTLLTISVPEHGPHPSQVAEVKRRPTKTDPVPPDPVADALTPRVVDL